MGLDKKHICSNGNGVTEQVVLYQKTRKSADYLPIYEYYDTYKNTWYTDVSELMDQSSFYADFDWKLLKAVVTFDHRRAKLLAKKYNWHMTGAFNRWFWKILTNWIVNVKTGSYRAKKRPSVICPVCGRSVVKIDEAHLQHYRTRSDLPKYFIWHDNIYQTVTKPSHKIVCWGVYSKEKYTDLLDGNDVNWQNDRTQQKWKWFLEDGSKGVWCPLDHKVVPRITNEYLKTLNKNVNRYAVPLTWLEFIELYKYSTLIEAEIYSLDYCDDTSNDGEHDSAIDVQNIDSVKIISPIQYDDVESIIEKTVENPIDRQVLKLIASGLEDKDICVELSITKSELNNRKKQLSLRTQLYDALI